MLYTVSTPDWQEAESQKLRVEEGLNIDVMKSVTPVSSLWVVDVATAEERKLTDDAS